jgi:hypothetical protein
LVVTALIYVGFGLVSDSISWILIEFSGVPVYAVFAWLGLKKSGWFLVIGWAFHTFWDAGLHGVLTPFVPHWYIGGGIGFDLLVAGYIGFREIKKIDLICFANQFYLKRSWLPVFLLTTQINSSK